MAYLKMFNNFYRLILYRKKIIIAGKFDFAFGGGGGGDIFM